MKRTQLFFVLFMLFAFSGFAQKDVSKRKSPPQQVSSEVGDAEIKVSYGSPSVRDRTVWGKLVPYHKVWRTGANEATTFETDKPIKIEGKTLKAGRYALFTIPAKDEWTIVFNSDADQWGAYNYDESLDVLRVKVKPTVVKEHTERMKFEITGDNTVVLKWDKLEIPFKVSK